MIDVETGMDSVDDEPGDNAPEDLLAAVTPPDEVAPDEVDQPDPPADSPSDPPVESPSVQDPYPTPDTPAENDQ